MGLFGNSKKSKLKKMIDEIGFTPEEFSLYQEYQKSSNEDAKLQLIAKAQERKRKEIKESTGVDPIDIVQEIGKNVSWGNIANHVFRVLDFNRSDTTIKNNQVIAKSLDRPYGYLLLESPIILQKVRMPIIHRDDFQLVAGVFDDPRWAEYVKTDELLVVYSPKVLRRKGFSGSPHHVLHYVLVPRGTLNSYYLMNNDEHFANPTPQKLFGQFVYEGEIRVQVIPEPKLQ